MQGPERGGEGLNCLQKKEKRQKKGEGTTFWPTPFITRTSEQKGRKETINPQAKVPIAVEGEIKVYFAHNVFESSVKRGESGISSTHKDDYVTKRQLTRENKDSGSNQQKKTGD